MLTANPDIKGAMVANDSMAVGVAKAIDAAPGLKSNRTHTIGMMIPNNSSPYFVEIIRGIQDTCFAAGFNVILCNSDDVPLKQSTYVRLLCEKQVDGLIVVSSGADDELIDTLRAAPMPQVVVDCEIDDLPADLVEVNHEAGAVLGPGTCSSSTIGASAALPGPRRCRQPGSGWPATKRRLLPPASPSTTGCSAVPTSPALAATRP